MTPRRRRITPWLVVLLLALASTTAAAEPLQSLPTQRGPFTLTAAVQPPPVPVEAFDDGLPELETDPTADDDSAPEGMDGRESVTPLSASGVVVEYYGLDAVGSVRVVFSATGAVQARADYTPFGAEHQSSGNLPAQRFTGQERDHEAAKDYFGARYYQTRHGRFSTVDPLFANALMDPQQWNRYAYVRNNPLAFVDPDGRQTLHFDDYVEVVGIGGGGGIGSDLWWLFRDLLRNPPPQDPFPLPDLGGGLPTLPETPPQTGTDAVVDAIGGGAVGGGGGLIDAVSNENRPDRSGNARLGRPGSNRPHRWDRTFHIDYHPKHGVHFNADFGPLKRLNHKALPSWLHGAGGASTLRVVGGGTVVGGVALYAYSIATAENRCQAVAGAAGGIGGGALGATLGSIAAPGVGTALGGAFGGALGGAVGNKVGGALCQ